MGKLNRLWRSLLPCNLGADLATLAAALPRLNALASTPRQCNSRCIYLANEIIHTSLQNCSLAWQRAGWQSGTSLYLAQDRHSQSRPLLGLPRQPQYRSLTTHSLSVAMQPSLQPVTAAMQPARPRHTPPERDTAPMQRQHRMGLNQISEHRMRQMDAADFSLAAIREPALPQSATVTRARKANQLASDAAAVPAATPSEDRSTRKRKKPHESDLLPVSTAELTPPQISETVLKQRRSLKPSQAPAASTEAALQPEGESHPLPPSELTPPQGSDTVPKKRKSRQHTQDTAASPESVLSVETSTCKPRKKRPLVEQEVATTQLPDNDHTAAEVEMMSRQSQANKATAAVDAPGKRRKQMKRKQHTAPAAGLDTLGIEEMHSNAAVPVSEAAAAQEMLPHADREGSSDGSFGRGIRIIRTAQQFDDAVAQSESVHVVLCYLGPLQSGNAQQHAKQQQQFQMVEQLVHERYGSALVWLVQPVAVVAESQQGSAGSQDSSAGMAEFMMKLPGVRAPPSLLIMAHQSITAQKNFLPAKSTSTKVPKNPRFNRDGIAAWLREHLPEGSNVATRAVSLAAKDTAAPLQDSLASQHHEVVEQMGKRLTLALCGRFLDQIPSLGTDFAAVLPHIPKEAWLTQARLRALASTALAMQSATTYVPTSDIPAAPKQGIKKLDKAPSPNEEVLDKPLLEEVVRECQPSMVGFGELEQDEAGRDRELERRKELLNMAEQLLSEAQQLLSEHGLLDSAEVKRAKAALQLAKAFLYSPHYNSEDYSPGKLQLLSSVRTMLSSKLITQRRTVTLWEWWGGQYTAAINANLAQIKSLGVRTTATLSAEGTPATAAKPIRQRHGAQLIRKTETQQISRQLLQEVQDMLTVLGEDHPVTAEQSRRLGRLLTKATAPSAQRLAGNHKSTVKQEYAVLLEEMVAAPGEVSVDEGAWVELTTGVRLDPPVSAGAKKGGKKRDSGSKKKAKNGDEGELHKVVGVDALLRGQKLEGGLESVQQQHEQGSQEAGLPRKGATRVLTNEEIRKCLEEYFLAAASDAAKSENERVRKRSGKQRKDNAGAKGSQSSLTVSVPVMKLLWQLHGPQYRQTLVEKAMARRLRDAKAGTTSTPEAPNEKKMASKVATEKKSAAEIAADMGSESRQHAVFEGQEQNGSQSKTRKVAKKGGQRAGQIEEPASVQEAAHAAGKLGEVGAKADVWSNLFSDAHRM